MDALTATMPATQPTGLPVRKPLSTGSDRDSELDAAAKGFEKMMVQRLLGEARRTRFGDEPSNAQSNYDAMYDEAIADMISERGTLGLADSLRRSLGDTGQVSVTQPASGKNDSAMPASERRGGLGLDKTSLATLRALVDTASGRTTDAPVLGGGAIPVTASGRGSAAPGGSPGAAIDDRRAAPLLASLANLAALAERRTAHAEPALGQREFLSQLQSQAQDTARRLGTAPEAVMAVAALESGWGRHPITDAAGRDANNLFGIKAHGRAGDSVTHRTHEYIGGQRRSVDAEFRAYAGPGDSVRDFGDFLIENPRYAPALEHAGDPERFLRALQEAGYATDPNYADKAIRVMQRVREHLAGDMS